MVLDIFSYACGFANKFDFEYMQQSKSHNMIAISNALLTNDCKSDSHSLVRGPLMVREISWSGQPIPLLINILCLAEHNNILSGPRTRKVWEPLF